MTRACWRVVTCSPCPTTARESQSSYPPRETPRYTKSSTTDRRRVEQMAVETTLPNGVRRYSLRGKQSAISATSGTGSSEPFHQKASECRAPIARSAFVLNSTNADSPTGTRRGGLPGDRPVSNPGQFTPCSGRAAGAPSKP